MYKYVQIERIYTYVFCIRRDGLPFFGMRGLSYLLLWLSIYLSIHMCIYLYTYICVCVNIYTHMHTCTHTLSHTLTLSLHEIHGVNVRNLLVMRQIHPLMNSSKTNLRANLRRLRRLRWGQVKFLKMLHLLRVYIYTLTRNSMYLYLCVPVCV